VEDFYSNHAEAIVACDFFVSMAATFRVLYVFVAMEIDSRRILHFNVTSHPTAEWTVQQFREFLAFDHPYQFVIHDRDSIFSTRLDAALERLRCPGFEDAGSCAKGECVLRKADRHDPARMSRLHNRVRRISLAKDLAKMGEPLQPWKTSLVARTWNSGAAPSQGSGQRPSTPIAKGLLRRLEARSQRLASRIQLGKGGSLAADRIIAEHKLKSPGDL
jgi:hypothetical protein